MITKSVAHVGKRLHLSQLDRVAVRLDRLYSVLGQIGRRFHRFIRNFLFRDRAVAGFSVSSHF